jgi:hypothetical protein
MLTFLALVGVAIAISGAMAFAFFWPMALVHLRDRHAPELARFGDFAFASPAALVWLLRGRYRELADRGLDGLCTPARLALWSIILSLVAAGVLRLFAAGIEGAAA